MLIRQDFHDHSKMLPPRLFLEQVMDGISKVYCFLWDLKDSEYKIDMSWNELKKFYNKNTFRTGVRRLNNEGLLSYKESADGISIELISWDEFVD